MIILKQQGKGALPDINYIFGESCMSEKTLNLPITGMSCANCAANIERTLNKKVEGVVSASVNFASQRLLIDYIPSIVSIDTIVSEIKKIGFDLIVVDEGQDEEDVEEIARHAEIKNQTLKFYVGVVFALPLFIISMSRDFGLIGSWSHASWVNWFFFSISFTFPGISRPSFSIRSTASLTP